MQEDSRVLEVSLEERLGVTEAVAGRELQLQQPSQPLRVPLLVLHKKSVLECGPVLLTGVGTLLREAIDKFEDDKRSRMSEPRLGLHESEQLVQKRRDGRGLNVKVDSTADEGVKTKQASKEQVFFVSISLLRLVCGLHKSVQDTERIA